MQFGYQIMVKEREVLNNKKPTEKAGLSENLVGTRGFEPPTPDTP
jgi:hypothetical protein